MSSARAGDLNCEVVSPAPELLFYLKIILFIMCVHMCLHMNVDLYMLYIKRKTKEKVVFEKNM